MSESEVAVEPLPLLAACSGATSDADICRSPSPHHNDESSLETCDDCEASTTTFGGWSIAHSPVGGSSRSLELIDETQKTI